MASIINVTGWEKGYIDTSGNLVVNTTGATSGYVEVVGGTTYTINCNSSLTMKRFAFYDSSKNFISREISSSTCQAPSNCKYIRVTLGEVSSASDSLLNGAYLSYDDGSGGEETVTRTYEKGYIDNTGTLVDGDNSYVDTIYKSIDKLTIKVAVPIIYKSYIDSIKVNGYTDTNTFVSRRYSTANQILTDTDVIYNEFTMDSTITKVRVGFSTIVGTSTTIVDEIFSAYTVTSDSGQSGAVVNVTGIELDANLLTVKVGKTLNINATISPSDATDQTVTWVKDNNNVNISANGLNCAITGVTVGTSNVTVTTNDGSITSTCAVTVIEDSSSSTDTPETLEGKYNLPWLLNKRSNNINQYKFYDKKYYSLGDSIVANNDSYYGYQSHIVDQLGMVLSNYGEGGATVVSKLSSYLALDFTDVALVTIGFGTNDARTGVPLGEIGTYDESSHSSTTFYGAYRTLLDKIYTDNPECRVVLLTPPQRKYVTNFGCDTVNSNGLKLIDYVDAIIKIGEMYATPVCDMYRESGINQCNLNYYTVEGVHPKQKGYERMANLLLNTIDKF